MVEEFCFGTGPSGPLTARFFRSSAEMSPIVIALHGGAWRGGSPHRYDRIGELFAEAGIALFAMEYTLITKKSETWFPAQMKDVSAASTFVAENCATLGVDAKRIGLMGDSAGATLAALYAQGQYRESGAADICAMVGIYGVYDLLAQFEHDLLHRSDDQITAALLGVSALADRRAYQKASPLSYAVRRPNAPVSLIVWGMEDDIVDCATQSEAYLSALKRVGQRARGLPVPGAAHFWIDEPIDLPTSHARFAVPRILSFLQANL